MSYKGLIAAALLAAPVLGMATEYRIVERPRQECWNEQVPVHVDHGLGRRCGLRGHRFTPHWPRGSRGWNS